MNKSVYFTGQIVFAIHPACDAKYHLVLLVLHFKWEMWRKMSLIWSTHVQHQLLHLLIYFFVKSHNAKAQLEVAECITKCAGQFLKEVMTITGNSSYYRLITTDYKINFDHCVSKCLNLYIDMLLWEGRHVPYRSIAIKTTSSHWRWNCCTHNVF